MNLKDVANLLEEELQHSLHIEIRSVKPTFAVLAVEDEEGRAFSIRITKVKTKEAESDSAVEDADDDDVTDDDDDDDDDLSGLIEK